VLTKLVQDMLDGDRHSLAKLFTLLETDNDNFLELMSLLHQHTGKAYCIGVTGSPGVGKSTLIDSLLQMIRKQGLKAGVIAVDPSSPFTGGAVLGDRIRMSHHVLDDGVFIRSLASRGAQGGLSRVTGAGVNLLDAYGADIVLVESVGVGQTELDVMNIVDTVVVVMVPEGGDSVQISKAGLIEIADIFVVNKSDRPGAERLAGVIGSEMNLNDETSWWKPSIHLTQANNNQGINHLWQSILDHRRVSEETFNLESRRSKRRILEFSTAVQYFIDSKLRNPDFQDQGFESILSSVEKGDLDPYSAVKKFLSGSNS
jgi:LAO/AO transport system kinase